MFVWQPGLQISCWVMLVSWEGEEWLILSIQGSVIHSDVSDSLPPHGLWPASFLCPWNFAGNNTGENCDALLQGIFPTQGSNSGLLHCRQILYYLSHQGGTSLIKPQAVIYSLLIFCHFPSGQNTPLST